MPVVDEKYVAPTWQNGDEPAIDADELQAMSDAIERTDNLSNLSFGQAFGVCGTASGTAEKAVTISGFVLSPGALVGVRFTADVEAGASLNVSGTGAKAIRYRNAGIVSGAISAGDTAVFMYDGTYWQLIASDGNLVFSGVRAVTGSYFGTGTYGSSYPNSLPVSERARVIFIQGRDEAGGGILLKGDPSGCVRAFGNGFSAFSVYVTWSDSSVFWYAATDSYQMNINGYRYDYTILEV